jgi:xanthine dehydrogenase iron-sulfur cluster and FAD-binding subunit A
MKFWRNFVNPFNNLVIPFPLENEIIHTEKISRRSAFDWPIAICGFYMKLKEKTVKEMNLYLGGVDKNRVKRLKKVEQYFIDKEITKENIEHSMIILMNEMDGFDIEKDQEEYKKDLSKVFLNNFFNKFFGVFDDEDFCDFKYSKNFQILQKGNLY